MKKLTLRRETVRKLSTADLRHAAGGANAPSDSIWANSCIKCVSASCDTCTCPIASYPCSYGGTCLKCVIG